MDVLQTVVFIVRSGETKSVEVLWALGEKN